MQQPTSPRLPGVPLLQLDVTGAEYSRWRRSIKFALETKGTWKFCNGEAIMPMPEAGSRSKRPDQETSTTQPSLLEERRAWVRQDREVKLDVYLSLTEDVMLEVFEVGPPLPPSNLSALQIIETLDERFISFKFEAYHHAFCHFLNLHIDQYATIAEFNDEYMTTLEDLVDYGHPLSNMQACSAYLSKLRCTQNVWAATMLREWDAHTSEPQLSDLMNKSLLHEPVRPLPFPSPHNHHKQSMPDETYDSGSARSSIEAAIKFPHALSVLRRHHHARSSSATTTGSEVLSVAEPSRNAIEPYSSISHRDLSDAPVAAIPQRRNARKGSAPTRSIVLDSDSLNGESDAELINDIRSKSASPRLPGVTHEDLTPTDLEELFPSPTVFISNQSPSRLMSDNVPHILRHVVSRETLRSQLLSPLSPPPLSEHPAFRTALSASNDPEPVSTARPTVSPISTLSPSFTTFSPPLNPDFNASSPSLALPSTLEPNHQQRPHSSSADIPTPTELPPPDLNDDTNPYPSHSSSTTNSSTITLPLQGIQTSSWDYLQNTTRPTTGETIRAASVSPVQSLSLSDSITALPQIPASRSPKFEDFVAPAAGRAAKDGGSKTKSLDLKGKKVGKGLGESGSVRGGEKGRKKAWSMGVDFSRFSHHKGVREII